MTPKTQKSYVLPYEELDISFKEYLRMINVFGNNQGFDNVAQAILGKDEFHTAGEIILRAKEAGDKWNNPLEAVVLHPDQEPQYFARRNGPSHLSDGIRRIKFIFAKPIV